MRPVQIGRDIITYYKESFGGLSRSIWILSAITFINRSGTMVLPFLSLYLTDILEFTMADAGYILSAFGAGSLVGTFIGGKLTDRFGHYRVQFWSLFLTGFMFWLLVVMESFGALVLTIFMTSMIADAFRPANQVSVAVYSRIKNRTRSLALLRMAINLGFTIGPAIGGVVAASIGYSWLFWLDGGTCIIASLGFLFFLKEHPKKEHQAEASREEVELDLEKRSNPYRDRPYWMFLLVVFLTSLVFLQLFFTVPVFFKDVMLLGEDQIGLLFGLSGLLVATFEMPVIYRFEGLVKLSRLLIIGAFLIGLSMGLFAIFNWPGIAIISIILITFGEIFFLPFSNTFALNRAHPKARGDYMALFAMAWSLSHILSPSFGLQTVDALGYSAFWSILFGVSCLGILGIIRLQHTFDEDIS